VSIKDRAKDACMYLSTMVSSRPDMIGDFIGDSLLVFANPISLVSEMSDRSLAPKVGSRHTPEITGINHQSAVQ